MLAYAAKRVAIGLVTLWAASMVIFIAVQALPGDAAQAALGRDASPSLLALYRRELGLDQPTWTQYGHWLGGLCALELWHIAGISSPGI